MAGRKYCITLYKINCFCSLGKVIHLPVILGLQELELVFDPVTGLSNSEFESRLTWLMGRLKRSVDIAISTLHYTTTTSSLEPLQMRGGRTIKTTFASQSTIEGGKDPVIKCTYFRATYETNGWLDVTVLGLC